MAAVIDLFSRRVVGWSMNANMTAQFVTDALIMAIWRAEASRMRFFTIRTRAANTRASSSSVSWLITASVSMSRSGNVWDKCRDGKLLLITQNGKDSSQGLQD